MYIQLPQTQMKVRQLLFAATWLLYPTLCLSCGEPGLNYGTEISSDPSSPELGRPLELKCRVSQSSLDQWKSSVVSSGSNLTWSEGPLTNWSAYDGRAVIYNNAAGEVVLRISNFSIDDYGVYRCHCVNDFTFLQYEKCGETTHGNRGLPTHCSATTEIHLLPSNAQFMGVQTELVDTPGENVSLGPCTSSWARIGSSGLREDNASAEITVRSPQDQAKFICASSDTLQKIVYITIAGYQPLKIFYPTSDVASLAITIFTDQIPACATFTSFPATTTTALYAISQDTVVQLQAIPGRHTTTANTDQCGWITIYNVDRFSLEYDYPNSTFACTVTSQWETLSRNFTFASHFTTQEQSCPVHTVTSPLLAPYSSVMPSTSQQASSVVPSSTSHSAIAMLPSAQPSSPNSQVSAQTSISQSSSPLPPFPSPTGSSTSNSSVGVIAGAVVVAVLVVLVVVSGVVFALVNHRRRKKKFGPRKMYRLPENDNSFIHEPSNGFSMHPSVIDSRVSPLHPSGTLSITPQQISHNGVPISRQMAKCILSLQQSPWLFPYEKLEFGEELGSGAFGVVKKALAHSLQPGAPDTVVAVKMLKDGVFSNEQEEKDIISELKVLMHVEAHPNIVCLLGASVNNGMLHVIVEYCCNGNLLNYLRSKRNDQTSPLTARHCVDMAAQVATGMEFLASKDCIHRDLAARNVLITEDYVVKVADFGLARKVYESVYRPSGGKVPVKWLAPESIIDHVYTSQSDVWSFGIVLWEILTLGRAPYPGKSAETMLRDLEEGYRMPRPPSCPVQIYDVMLKCWQWSAIYRPTFSQLVKLLEEILTADEPALNRHYYNMDISGRRSPPDPETSIDSTLCSCEDLDSSAGQFYTCHSCGNAFTTTRILSSDPAKIHCDDCSQMPEYLSRSSLDLLSSCDEPGSRSRRWSQKIHSNDSGVKMSAEGTAEDYQVAAGVRATAFARKLAESLQSMCSECKVDLEPALVGDCLLNQTSSQSLSSICTECRAHMEGEERRGVVSPTVIEYGSREREEYMRRRKEKLLASRQRPRPVSTDDSLFRRQGDGRRDGEEEEEVEDREGGEVHMVNGFRQEDEEGEEEGEEEEREEEEGEGEAVDMVNGFRQEEEEEEEEWEGVHVVNGFSEEGEDGVNEFSTGFEKVELRQKFSNDSGIKMTPEPTYAKRLSAPPMTRVGRISPCTPRPAFSLQPSGCSTPAGRLSAHPRNRDMFDELGIEETDV